MSVQQRYPEFVADQRRFFDELITEDWETYASAEWDLTRRFEVARLFERIKPRRILDVGCGCGFHDQAMAQYPFVERIDAIDYSQKSIERAERSYPHPKVHRWVEDFLTAPGEAAYDLVLSFQVFEHLDRPDDYLAAAARRTAATGHIGIFTPNRRRLDNRIRALRGEAPVLCDPMHYKEYTPAEIVALGRRHGLVKAASFGVGLHSEFLTWVGALAPEKRLRAGQWLPSIATGFCVLMQKAP